MPLTRTGPSLVDRLAALGSVREMAEAAIAEEIIALEEDLRGPTRGSPSNGRATGPNPLSPGPGLVPVNTGRLLQSYGTRVRGTRVVLTARARRRGRAYAGYARHAGQPIGDSARRVTQRWIEFARRVDAAVRAAARKASD